MRDPPSSISPMQMQAVKLMNEPARQKGSR